MKYLCCTGVPDREIIATYGQTEMVVHISGRPFFSFGNKIFLDYVDDNVNNIGMRGTSPLKIMQIILMQSYFLVQLHTHEVVSTFTENVINFPFSANLLY